MISPSTLDKIFGAVIFAVEKHQGQVRKDEHGSPYVSHPLLVAQAITQIGSVTDNRILIAAILHDTIEDTETSPNEVREKFGEDILNLVLEVTDDKSLNKMERKRLQVIHAPNLSDPARIIKLGDKLINCRDILYSPPKDWKLERRQDYIQWCADVIAHIRDTNAPLEAAFDAILAEAEIRLNYSIEPLQTLQNRAWAPNLNLPDPQE